MAESEVQQTQHTGLVLDVDHDADTVRVLLDGEGERTLPFEAFDAGDVYQAGQRFSMVLDASGAPLTVSPASETQRERLPGYVESVDTDDELVWVYLRDTEGWHRKVIPLQLFVENDLAAPGRHFFLELDEDGTPCGLEPDDSELEMQLQPVEEAKPRWTQRPAAESD